MDEFGDLPDLLVLVQQLGPQLVSNELEKRLSGVQTLEKAILRTPVSSLEGGQVKSLTEFMNAKIGDHHSICSCAFRSLVHLTASALLPASSAMEICRQIFAEIQTQSLNQADRHNVYLIFRNILSHHCTEIIDEMSNDFVFGFIQTIEGERDPRNLIVTFRLAEAVIKRFNIDRFVEEIFDVLACYFPVVFIPPPNDSRGITREMLVESNRACLIGSPKFAEQLLPLILEKLQENEPQTRQDSLEILAMAVPTYSLRDLQMYQGSLIDCFQKEVTRGGQPEIERAVHTAVVSFTKAFSTFTDAGNNKKPLLEFVDQLFKVSASDLVDEDIKRSLPTGKLLLSMASAHPSALERVAMRSVPLVIQNKTNEYFLSSLLDLARSMNYNEIGHHFAVLNNVDPNEKFPSIVLLLRLILIPDFIDDDRARRTAIQAMTFLQQNGNNLADIRRQEIIKLLAEIAIISNSGEAMETDASRMVGGELLVQWKQAVTCTTSTESDRNSARELLQVCAEKSAFLCEQLIIWMIKEMETVNTELRMDLLNCLSAIILEISDSHQAIKVSEVILLNLPALESYSTESAEHLVEIIGQLTVLGSSETQRMIFDNVKIQMEKQSSKTAVDIMCAVVCSLSIEAAEKIDCPSLLEQLYFISKESEAGIYAYGTLLNKTASNEDAFDNFITKVEKMDWNSAAANEHLWFLICVRGLFMRNHPTSEKHLQSLLALLDSQREEIVTWTAERLHVLVCPLPKVFHKGVEYFIWIQKCFLIILNYLSPRCRAVKDERSQLFVSALVQLAGHVRQEILHNDINTILPFLMKALVLPKFPDAQKAALKVLQAVAETGSHSSTVADYADDFLPALLPMLDDSPIDCRLNSARLLQSCLPHLNPITLRAHRAPILRQLSRAVNDRKRTVRREAMCARNKWLVASE